MINYLHLCGNIPESYGHDTSEEKLYSKYTDCLLSLAYSSLGLKSLVLKERADAADVETFNKTILSFSKKIQSIWDIEKGVATENISIAKEEALTFLAQEREKIMRMTHKEVLKELIKIHKIESRIKTINVISDNGLFTLK